MRKHIAAIIEGHRDIEGFRDIGTGTVAYPSGWGGIYIPVVIDGGSEF